MKVADQTRSDTLITTQNRWQDCDHDESLIPHTCHSHRHSDNDIITIQFVCVLFNLRNNKIIRH